MMHFWTLQQPDDAVAAIDARSGREWTYAELRENLQRMQAALPTPGRKTLGLLLAKNTVDCLIVYLAALNADNALILLDADLNPDLLQTFVSTYEPDWVYTTDLRQNIAGYSASPERGLLSKVKAQDLEIHSDLALLLNTSGSTGSPKLVRLTLANLEANAAAIAEYLALGAQSRPITSLPMPYSYGLSVINSHLHVGGSIVFTEDGVLRREFWTAVDRYRCSSIAGVPYTYQLLLQAGMLNKLGASLNTLTQAGGRLDEEFIRQMIAVTEMRNSRFFVMYGQTEATARISYVPPDRLWDKVGSVGIAIPGGLLTVDEQTGELLYRGPNVMMGYAETQQDLTKPDELNGMLRTGDLARQDVDGFFYITGRLKRFLKIFGKRFNLDEVERILGTRLQRPIACFGTDDKLMIGVESSGDADSSARIFELMHSMFELSRTAFQVVVLEQIPRTGNGKVDYQSLTAITEGQPSAIIG
jgi:long-chain acyl-CoA synthetase